MTTIKTPKKRRNEIVRMWENTNLNRREVSEIFKMPYSTVLSILKSESAEKFKPARPQPDDLNPCILSLSVWPRCYGRGCYWVGEDGESVCLAYNAMQARMAG